MKPTRPKIDAQQVFTFPAPEAKFVSSVERYRAQHGDTVTARAPRELFETKARQCARDPMAVLRGLDLALTHNVPVPDHIAQVLQQAIWSYQGGHADSLDAALGLTKPGKSSPRRAAMEKHSLRVALGRMLYLHSIGATIEQAAVLAARMGPEFAVSTLIDRYKRSGHGAVAKVIREHRVAWEDPESTLSAYPDGPLEVAQAKAAIRKVYAKHRS